MAPSAIITNNKRKECYMKTLIVEDDFVARQLLKGILSDYSECDIVVDGEEAVQAHRIALEDGEPYDLICMDIMMPNMDGKESLKRIREFEKDNNISGSKEAKVIMITALGDPKTVFESFYKSGATSYLVKPINEEKFFNQLRLFELI